MSLDFAECSGGGVASPAPSSELSALMTTQDVAEYLGVSIRTVKRWRSNGVGPTYCKLPGAKGVRYFPPDVRAYAKAGRRTSTYGA